jgi:hypothetical protein
LYELSYTDAAEGVYKQFNLYWEKQKKQMQERKVEQMGMNSNDDCKNDSKGRLPSLSVSLLQAFGGPFMGAGFLKLMHDTLIFVGPLALNKLILFLKDPTQVSRV